MARPSGMTDEEYWEYLFNADDSQLDDADREWYNSNTKDGKYVKPKEEKKDTSNSDEPTGYIDSWRHGLRDIGNAWSEFWGDGGVADTMASEGKTYVTTSPNGDGTYAVKDGDTGEVLSNGDYGDGLMGKSSEAIVRGYKDAVDKAQNDYNNVWGLNQSVLTQGTKRDDGTDRTLASSLNEYDKTMEDLNNQSIEQMNPQANANKFINPYTQQQIDTANNAIQGASGAKLQSLATQNKIAQNTAGMAQNAYNSGVTSAVNNANQNLSGINSQWSNAENILTNDATPEQDLMASNMDWAGTNLETNTAMADTIANTESKNKGFFGNFISAMGNR